MAQEGIATLPQAPENQAVMSDIDQVKQSVGQRIPGADQIYDQTMDQATSQLNLPPDQLQQMLQILQYMLSHEQEYVQIRQRLISEGGVRPEDLPEQFDRGYLTTMLLMVQEALKRQGGGGAGPMAQAPQPQGFQKGGLAAAAQSLAAKGRGGDTILAHINPQEAMMLKAMGGSGTINPSTGIMEFKGGGGFNPLKAVGDAFKSVGDAVKSVASSTVGKIVMTVALGVALGPAGLAMMPAWAAGAVAAGAVSMAGGNSLSDSLKAAAIGGVAGYFSPGLSDSIGSLGQTGALGQFINQGLTGAAIGTGYGLLTGQTPGQALKTGAIAGLTAGAVGAVMPGARTDGGAPTADSSAPFGSDVDVNTGTINTPTTADQANLITNQGGSITPNSEGISNLQAPQLSRDFDTTDFSSPQVSQAPQLSRDFDTTDFSSPQAPQVSQVPQPSRDFDTTTPQPRSFGDTASDYYNQGKDYLFGTDPKNPGVFMNKEGGYSIPAITAGVLGIGALTGSFDSKDQGYAPTGIGVDKNVTGESLVASNPNKYIVGNIPGYNAPQPTPAQANYVAAPAYGMNQRLPFATYTPPIGAVSGQQGQPIQQPYNTAAMYNFMPRMYAQGGISQVYPRRTGGINGPGTGTSDSIPAMLSDGEFVITAKAVRGAGNGSRREGAKKLYRMMHALEKKAK